MPVFTTFRREPRPVLSLILVPTALAFALPFSIIFSFSISARRLPAGWPRKGPTTKLALWVDSRWPYLVDPPGSGFAATELKKKFSAVLRGVFEGRGAKCSRNVPQNKNCLFQKTLMRVVSGASAFRCARKNAEPPWLSFWGPRSAERSPDKMRAALASGPP